MNTTTSLIVNNPNAISSLVNKDLRKNVTAMVQASTGLSKSMWKYGIAVYNIISGELFKDDFKTQRAFGKALDVNESTISRCCKAVEMAVNVLPEYGYGMEVNEEKGIKRAISFSNAYLLSTVENLKDFMEKYSDTDFSIIGKNQLEKIISLYKKPQENAVDVKPNETKGNTSNETESANKGDITANVTDGMLTFTYRNKKYSVPMKDLKKYIIQE